MRKYVLLVAGLGVAFFSLAAFSFDGKDYCGAAQLTPLKGLHIDAIRSSLPTGQMIRIEEPGHVYSQDYSAHRLRITLTDERLVSGFSCG